MKVSTAFAPTWNTSLLSTYTCIVVTDTVSVLAAVTCTGLIVAMEFTVGVHTVTEGFGPFGLQAWADACGTQTKATAANISASSAQCLPFWTAGRTPEGLCDMDMNRVLLMCLCLGELYKRAGVGSGLLVCSWI